MPVECLDDVAVKLMSDFRRGTPQRRAHCHDVSARENALALRLLKHSICDVGLRLSWRHPMPLQ